MQDFIRAITHHFKNNQPFFSYNKPNSNKVITFLQENDQLNYNKELIGKGVVFAPFVSDDFIFFNEKNCEILNCEIDFLPSKFNDYQDKIPSNEVKRFHENLVKEGVQGIEKGWFQKVVLSRKEEVEAQQDEFINYFIKLIQNYKTAFCYCFYHPKVGMWLGATPEQLVKQDVNIISTVALAGTQLSIDNKEVVWFDKEKEEQLFVTQFIENSLKGLVENLQKTKPYTFEAGTLLHIKTDISAIKQKNVEFLDIVKALHPTPALCGLPKIEARDFILKKEGYDREFYSGFLGEINKDFENNLENKSDLYVNLRCMKLDKSVASIFVGGGITKDSVPENEFVETINKTQTIKKVLK